MNVALEIDDPRLREWLRFWQRPWREMDASWLDSLQSGIKPRLADAWQCAPPELLRRRLKLGRDAPPMPSETLLQWCGMSPQAREQVLYLAAEVVVPEVAAQCLEPEDRAWCRHLAKALMPGSWPVSYPHGVAAEPLGLAMLRQWLSPAIWARLRLHYRRTRVEEGESLALEEIPVARLNPLWHGVIWRGVSSEADR
ncbi:hypothetical protein ACUY1T_21505 [Billgrantia sp. Q4P2]|uniref:hypothetical protein n=1 Tax=Billgrantia sp. Q4P2 TaxID=3463857 RepID=UPI0040572C5A